MTYSDAKSEVFRVLVPQVGQRYERITDYDYADWKVEYEIVNVVGSNVAVNVVGSATSAYMFNLGVWWGFMEKFGLCPKPRETKR